MNTKILKIFLVLGLFAAIGIAIGLYLYTKPSKDIVSGKAEFALSTTALLSEFINDENAANAKYLNKIVQIEGKVFEVLRDENGVTVLFESEDPLATVSARISPIVPKSKTNFNAGQTIKLKGKVTGFLNDVNLNLCDIVP